MVSEGRALAAPGVRGRGSINTTRGKSETAVPECECCGAAPFSSGSRWGSVVWREQAKLVLYRRQTSSL